MKSEIDAHDRRSVGREYMTRSHIPLHGTPCAPQNTQPNALTHAQTHTTEIPQDSQTTSIPTVRHQPETKTTVAVRFPCFRVCLRIILPPRFSVCSCIEKVCVCESPCLCISRKKTILLQKWITDAKSQSRCAQKPPQTIINDHRAAWIISAGRDICLALGCALPRLILCLSVCASVSVSSAMHPRRTRRHGEQVLVQ